MATREPLLLVRTTLPPSRRHGHPKLRDTSKAASACSTMRGLQLYSVGIRQVSASLVVSPCVHPCSSRIRRPWRISSRTLKELGGEQPSRSTIIWSTGLRAWGAVNPSPSCSCSPFRHFHSCTSIRGLLRLKSKLGDSLDRLDSSSPGLRCGWCCHLPNTESGGERRRLRTTCVIDADTPLEHGYNKHRELLTAGMGTP
jgi:hypothetical protein